MSYLLSKSRYLAGLQCPKLLWWRVKEPKAPELEPDVSLQLIFDQGTEVGEKACEYFPGGVLIDLPHWEDEARAEATREAMASGAPAIYEATFVEDDVFVAVDILARTESGGWRMAEVKSTMDLKDVHLPDVAVQAWVLVQAGVPLDGVEVMHLSRECVYPDLSNLFVREDVTEQVMDLLPDIPRRIRAQKELLDGPLPEVEVGPHCSDPYDCPFSGRCWPEPAPHGVGTLYRGGKKAAALEEMGVETVGEIPDDFPLSDIQERQRCAARTGATIVEGDLDAALSPLSGPAAFLDFETVGPAIPRWDGCSPYNAVPVQFSCHLVEDGGTVRHEEWLATGPGDPRPEIAERLVDLLADEPVIVAYHSSFEARCLKGLAEAVPEHAEALLSMAERLQDLLPVVRSHVYHPDFDGSFSLKKVLPALVPDVTYQGLEVKNGSDAAAWLFRILLEEGKFEADRLAGLRRELLAYCEIDTLALVRLREVLEGMG